MSTGIGLIRTNALVFMDAMNGNGVFCVRDPQELYNVYEMFQDTYYNFFNMNTLSKEDLLVMSFRNNPERFGKILNVSDELMTAKDVNLTPRQHVLNMAVYYYLKENYGFKGFPAYFHIRNSWDVNKYQISKQVSTVMGLEQDQMKQIEVLYSAGDQLSRVNDVNSLSLTKSIELINSIWKVEPGSDNSDGQYAPLILKNTIRQDACFHYPVCYVGNIELGGIRAMKNAMQSYTSCQTRVNQVALQMSNSISTMLVVDDPFEGKTRNQIIEIVDQIMKFVFENIPLKVYSHDDLQDIDTFLAFFGCGSTESINLLQSIELGEIPSETYPMYILITPGEYIIKYFYNIGEGNKFCDYNDLRSLVIEANVRLAYLLSCSKSLLYSLPMLGTFVPPRYIQSVWEMMLNDMKTPNIENTDVNQ